MSKLTLIATDAKLTKPEAVAWPDGGLDLDPVVERMSGATTLWLAALDQAVVGLAAFLDDGPTPEIGYGISPSYRGKGLAKHVVTALCATARARGLSALTARTAEANPASGAVLAAQGFTQTASADEAGVGRVIHWRWDAN